jgi:hypothetical protein
VKPNFFLVGAFKGGTTTIYHHLKQHPQVFMCTPKEPRFFAFDPDDQTHRDAPRTSYPVRTIDDYLALFETVTTEQTVGDASPIYLNSPIAAQRIAAFNPDAKIIASLRDPVARSFSGYQMHVRAGNERRSVEEAMLTGERWVEGSRYAASLRRYYDHFPASQIKVVLLEQLDEAWLRELCVFLGVDPEISGSAETRLNVGGLPRNARKQRMLTSVKRFGRRFRSVRRLVPDWAVGAVRAMEAANLERAELPPHIDKRLAGYFIEDAAEVKSLTGLPTEIWDLERRARRTA